MKLQTLYKKGVSIGRKEREKEILEIIKRHFDGKIYKSKTEYIDLIKEIKEQEESKGGDNNAVIK